MMLMHSKRLWRNAKNFGVLSVTRAELFIPALISKWSIYRFTLGSAPKWLGIQRGRKVFTCGPNTSTTLPPESML